MKQVLLNYRTGQVSVADVPPPSCKPDNVLVGNLCSAISAGTERSSVNLAQSTFLGKAQQRPEQVQQILNTLRQEGALTTFKKVSTRLDTLSPLGYCSAGVVLKAGRNVVHVQEGDRVACAGEGFGSHAEIVSVPRLLCHRISDGLGSDQAAFAALGAIALQTVRQAQVVLGEKVAVIGLGLVGLLVVQFLKAAGCRVFGVDPDGSRCNLARKMGADRVSRSADGVVTDRVQEFSDGYGVDAVLVMASTDSREPLVQAGSFCRERGRVVVAGRIPLEFPRGEYWKKELSLCMSRSFGPGYYDPTYTEHCHDYPFGYARWTAGRNIRETLAFMESGQVTVDRLITHRFRIEQAEEAYELLVSQNSPVLGAVFDYDGANHTQPSQNGGDQEGREGREKPATGDMGEQYIGANGLSAISAMPAISRLGQARLLQQAALETLRIGWIGAGDFAQAYLIPEFQKRPGVLLDTVANSTSSSAYDVRRKFRFGRATCNSMEVLDAAELNSVVITTRHELHADLAVEALQRNKHVFLEKPIALTLEDLLRLLAAARESRGAILVGFNRRFAPLVTWLREYFEPDSEPIMLQYRINAGPLPAGHWVRDSAQGGGRIIGEICHFVDLCHYLAGASPVSVFCQALPGLAGLENEHDNVQLQIRFANGSLAQVSYTAVADPAFPRERLEVVGQGAIGAIDNFRTALVSRKGKRWNKRLWARDMGYGEEVHQFVTALLKGRSMPVAFEKSALSMLATLLAVESLRTAKPVEIDSNAVFSEASLLP